MNYCGRRCSGLAQRQRPDASGLSLFPLFGGPPHVCNSAWSLNTRDAPVVTRWNRRSCLPASRLHPPDRWWCARERRRLARLKKAAGLSTADIVALVRAYRSGFVPVTIFATDLTPLEAITKYLREHQGLRYCAIARLVGRDQRTIRATYLRAATKHQGPLPAAAAYWFPLDALQDRRLSVLEHVVAHLWYQRKLGNAAIARLIKRDRRTIGTITRRIRTKAADTKPSSNSSSPRASGSSSSRSGTA